MSFTDLQVGYWNVLGSGAVLTTGNVFFVDSNIGSDDAASGKDPLTPFDTIDYAIGKCTANNGDVIYVAPGHTESIIAAGTITMDIAGVSIVGLGSGTDRPTLTWTTSAAATFLVSAANCSIRNFYFDMTGVNAVAYGFAITAANFKMLDCEVYFAKTSYVAIKVMSATSASYADGLTLIGNHWHGDGVASCTSALQLVGGDKIVIKDNVIVGNFTTSLGAINNVTAALTNVTIQGNLLENRTALATKCIVLYTGSTGRVVDNRMLFASVTIPVTADSCLFAGNYHASTFSTIATLL